MSSVAEDSFVVSDAESDAFVPSPAAAKKKAAPAGAKKTAAAAPKAKAAAGAPKKKPLAKSKANLGADGEGELNNDDVVMVDATNGSHSMSSSQENVVPVPAVAVAASSSSKTATQTYQKLSQLEHVLKRPDTYIGSIEQHTEKLWVYDATRKQMAYRETTYVPGFYKIFDEILVNAADNKVRDPTMDAIKVTIDKNEGSISVWNSGKGIPIEMHEKEGVYIPELIFGHLLTSSNYDDDEAKVTGGRNGYGAKLANIYSTEFTVETAEARTEQKYKQVFTKNMSDKGKPKITKNKGAKDFTQITFKPDLARFGMDRIDDDIEALMMKRVYDMAGTVKDVKVFLNGERLKIKGFKQYVEMYVSAINELSNGGPAAEPKVDEDGDLSITDGAAPAPTKQTIIFDSTVDRGKTWEVAFAVSDGEFRQVSFVNNIATIKGGKHVDLVEQQIVTKIADHVKKNKKNGPVKLPSIRQQLWVFVNCQIVNPTFDGQTKETMTLKASAFGSKWTLSEEMLKKILRSGVVDNVLSFAKFQQEKQLKRTDGHKRTRITGITKLEDANNAGDRRRAKDCTLILTEGDSAKALAVSGLTEVGRDNYGVFPLRGKLLNVREAGHEAIMKNTEISAIKTIMGLQHGKQYMSVDSLRYGSLMIMTDQDHDGSHIKGLIINFLDHFFPSLLKQPNFLVEFITPIVKCTKGKQEISFFTLPEYEVWKEEHNDGRGWNIKYYKGLGTSTAQDAKKYFRAMNKHMLPFQTTQEGDRELIDLAFNKKKADERKEWLSQFKPGTFLDHNIAQVPISDFINKELILFSMADNVRSIPSIVDGLKPGQRKVMFGCFKRKLKAEIKVAQLSGYIGEHSAYHHGDVSLTATIVNLAQDFVGANNVNVLMPNGQFGTRMMGGKDAASARYIFTNISDITRKIFHPADDNLLTYLNDDGQSIEPQWYMPTVPLVLINGSDGIGTGWSSQVPNYNPKDIVANLRRRMAGEEYVPMSPWYRGFTGTIVAEGGPGKYKCTGTYNQIDDKTWEITELPIRSWTSTYKELLEERLAGTEKVPAVIKEYKEYHTDTTVHFIIELNPKGQAEVAEKGPEVFFKLTTPISTTNMVLFDQWGKIKRYATPEEILDEFYLLRLDMYGKRKEFLVDELKMQYERLSNQARFVQMIISRELIVNNRKRAELVDELRKRDFRPFPKQGKAKVAAEVDDDDEAEDDQSGTDGDYDYLLSMAIWSLTKEKVDRLLGQRDEKERELNVLLRRTPQNLWDEDLLRFTEEWDKMLDEDERRLKDVSKNRKNKPGGGAAKGAKAGAKARKVLKKKAGSDDDDDDALDLDDDSEDEFKIAAPKPKKKPASPVKKPASGSAKAPAEAPAKPATANGGAPKRAVTDGSDTEKSPAKKQKSPLPFSMPKDENEDEDDYLVPTKAKAKPKAPAKSRSVSAASSAPKKKSPAVKVDLDDDDDDDASVGAGDEDGDDSIMADPPPKRAPSGRARKPTAAAAASSQKSAYVDDSDDGDEAHEEEDEDAYED
ncbi:type II DNA topoisomerase [Acaromyces ingoldii]|uniref:DNA topoisomerase 2 n=1 Tax=Acaromyces ingoldii TaxID=215250 RepID=A0A316YCY5_9BASI|nr:type II DNA topoisomerase [Acaromyces ingoldii]PWN87327.1 type II DNA topoisomerase [Acaromyces ingoldii]